MVAGGRLRVVAVVQAAASASGRTGGRESGLALRRTCEFDVDSVVILDFDRDDGNATTFVLNDKSAIENIIGRMGWEWIAPSQWRNRNSERHGQDSILARGDDRVGGKEDLSGGQNAMHDFAELGAEPPIAIGIQMAAGSVGQRIDGGHHHDRGRCERHLELGLRNVVAVCRVATARLVGKNDRTGAWCGNSF